ncbi:unnamed protein product [Neospora caninum Liverpool]|uniref:Dense granule protein GRA14 n=2 Tax=Neospora caninum TaxID=29176 RepID=F0VDQ1_NEOCL|nr:uncharacterized protein NCLIV_016360 [Neospora caninum Liverpool]AIJ04844.1 dense granule protein GRA14 [Neospora caninum]CBZ51844.1 unnamed protein product [Neospora caninum Liverpool]CEL65802.1 TPA: dense granule protein GRA14 [Neospora caninum Liverpool]|eukprot:XP_003881877.1 uncharacterized protein NCLIV_016360 [Neospora caninum Liverpool]
MQGATGRDRLPARSACCWLLQVSFFIIWGSTVVSAAGLGEISYRSTEQHPQQKRNHNSFRAVPTPQELIVSVSYLGDGLSFFMGSLRHLCPEVAVERFGSARTTPAVVAFSHKYLLEETPSQHFHSTASYVRGVLKHIVQAENDPRLVNKLVNAMTEVENVVKLFMSSVAFGFSSNDITALYDVVRRSLPETKGIVMQFLSLVSWVSPKERSRFNRSLLFLQDAVAGFRTMEEHVVSLISAEAHTAEEPLFLQLHQKESSTERVVVRGGMKTLQSRNTSGGKSRLWLRLVGVAAAAALAAFILIQRRGRYSALFSRFRKPPDNGGDQGGTGKFENRTEPSDTADVYGEAPPPSSPPMYPYDAHNVRWVPTDNPTSSPEGRRASPSAPLDPEWAAYLGTSGNSVY